MAYKIFENTYNNGKKKKDEDELFQRVSAYVRKSNSVGIRSATSPDSTKEPVVKTQTTPTVSSTVGKQTSDYGKYSGSNVGKASEEEPEKKWYEKLVDQDEHIDFWAKVLDGEWLKKGNEVYDTKYEADKQAIVDTAQAEYDARKAAGKATGWDVVGNTVMSGISGISSAYASTLDFLAPTEFLGKYDLFSYLSDDTKRYNDYWNAKRAASLEGKGKAAAIASDVGVGVIEAVPTVIEAIITGGGSLVDDGARLIDDAARLAAPYATKAGKWLGTTLDSAKTVVGNLLKNPAYYTSAAQTLGRDYEEAKANGASDAQAAITAIITTGLNAGVEVSGGIETLPKALKNADGHTVLKWLMSMPEEGIEEVVQRYVSGTVAKTIYDHDKAIFSTTNEDAIINPAAMGKEFLMGTAVGGILGGGQVGVYSAANAVNNNRLGKLGADYVDVKDDLISEGLSFGNGYTAYNVAEELQTKAESGEEISATDLGRLVFAIEQSKQIEVRHADPVSTVDTSVETATEAPVQSRVQTIQTRLAEGGMETAQAEVVAQSIDRILSGDPTVTGKDKDVLSVGNNAARAIFEEETGVKLPATNASTRKVVSEYIAQTAMSQQNQESAAPNVMEAWQNQKTQEETARQLKDNMAANPVANAASETLRQAAHQAVVTAQSKTDMDTLGEYGKTAYQKHIANAANAITFSNAFQRYYEAGLIGGIDFENIKTAYDHGISRAVLYEAYAAGQNDASGVPKGNSSSENKNARKGKKSPSKGKGRFYDNRTSEGKSASDGKTVTEEVIKALERFAKVFNIDIELVDTIADDEGRSYANGKYVNGKVVIAADSDNPLMTVLKHEVTHHIQRTNPAQYKAFKNYVMKAFYNNSQEAMNAEIQYRIDLAKKNNVTITRSQAMDEIVADATEKFLTDRDSIDALVKENRSLGETILNAIRDVLRKIEAAMKGEKIGDGGWWMDADQLRQAEKMWVEALMAPTTSTIASDTDGGVTGNVAATFNMGEGKVIYSYKIYHEPAYKQNIKIATGTQTSKLIREGKDAVELTGREVLLDLMKKSKATAMQQKKVLEFMDNMAQFMKDAEVKYRFIGLEDVNNATITVRRYKNGRVKDIVLSAMVKNGEYPVNFDFTKICKRREAMSKFVDALLEKHDSNTISLSAKNLMKINEILKDAGYDTACLGCFVEAKRYNVEQWAKSFVDKWNKIVAKYSNSDEYFNFASKDKANIADIDKVDEALKTYMAKNKYLSNLKKINAYDEVKWFKEFSPEAKAELLRRIEENMESDETKKSNRISPKKYMEIQNATEMTEENIAHLVKKHVIATKALSNEQKIESLIESDPIFQKQLRVADLITPDGITALTAMSKEFAGLVAGHYGSATPKFAQGFVPYNNEIAFLQDKVGKKSLAEYLVEIGGLRSQSFSDFKIENVFDYIQMVAELSARKLPAHIYTKEIACARILGKCGIKVNISVMFDVLGKDYWGSEDLARENAGLMRGENGELVYCVGDKERSDKVYAETGYRPFIQSAPFNEAVKLQNTKGYSSNVGIIGVGYGWKHIWMMLDDNRIRYIIPYHYSSLPVDVKDVTNLNLAQDFTAWQNTMEITGAKDADGNNVKVDLSKFKSFKELMAWAEENNYKLETVKAVAGHGDFKLYETLNKTGDPRKTAQAYIDWCFDQGYLPVFYHFAQHPNYYKMLFDFNVYDCITEKAAPQGAVKMWDEKGNIVGFDKDVIGQIEDEMQTQNDYWEQMQESFEPTLEKIYDAVKIDTGLKYDDAIDQLDKGTLDRTENTHLFVMDHTPRIYIDKADAKDLKIIMGWDIAYLAMKKEGDLPGHYHGLGAEIMKGIPKALEDPLYIIKQENGRIAAVTEVVVKGNRAVTVSVELDAFKTITHDGEAEAGQYNLIVTIFDAKPNYLQNNVFKGDIKYNKNNEDPAHFISRLKSLKKALPTNDRAESSIGRVPQPEDSVKGQFSYKDSTGKELSEGQQEYFKDSKVRDENGNLLVMYHGSKSKLFTEFDMYQGVWLTPDQRYAEVYADQWHSWRDDFDPDRPMMLDEADIYADPDYRLYEVYANITKPLDIGEINEPLEAKDVRRIASALGVNVSDLKAIADDYMDQFIYEMTRSPEFIELARKQRFDGFKATEKGRETWCAIQSADQVKKVDNLNPTEDPDIRYSFKDSAAMESDLTALREERADIEEQIDMAYLNGLSDAEIRKLNNRMTKVNAEIDKIVAEERKAVVKTPMQTILDNLGNYRRSDLESLAEQISEGAWDGYEDLSRAELEDALREEIQNRELTALEMQNKKFGLYVRPVEAQSQYQLKTPPELLEISKQIAEAEHRAKAVTDADIMSKAIKDLNLTGVERDVVKNYQEAMKNLAAYEKDLAVYDATKGEHGKGRSIYTDASGKVKKSGVKYSAEEKADIQRKVEWWKRRLREIEQKEAFKKVLKREKAEMAKRHAKEISDLRAKYDERLTTLREQRDAKVEAEKQKMRDYKQAVSEKNSAKSLRDKITRHASDLSKKLLSPNDKKHIPEELRGAVASVLEAINLESQYSIDIETGKRTKNADGLPTKRTEAFNKLRAQYAEIIETEDNQMVIDPMMQDMIDRVIAMSDVKLVDMSVPQLETVWEVLRAVEFSVGTFGKNLSDIKYEMTSDWASALVDDVSTRRKKNALTKSHVSIDMEDPYTFFSHYGDAGKAVFRMLRNAQDQQQIMTDRVKDEVSKIVTPKQVRDMENKTHTFTTERGDGLTLNTAQVMELYLLSKREQSIEHIMKGGIFQPEVESAKIRRGTDSILISMADLSNITGVLTDAERKIADSIQALTSGVLAEYGNEASMKAYGYEKFKEKNYWPINTSREGRNTGIEKGENNTRSIRNIGMAQSTKPKANNPLDLYGVFTTFANHTSDMVDYAAWLCPMEDVSRMFNYRYRDELGNQTGKTVKGLLDTYGGEKAQNYWFNLMEDIQNGINSPSDTSVGRVIAKSVGNFKGASVGANIRVVMQQPTAFFRAGVVLDGRDMARGALKGVTKGSGWEKALKYSPIAQRKATGGFDISNPMKMSEILFDDRTNVRKLNDFLSSPAGKADAITWGKIWNACEWTVSKKHKNLKRGSEEFYKKTAEVFSEVIDQTQVVDGVLQRSQIMRSSNEVVKQATSFMGEPTKALNIVMRSYDEFSYETDPKKRVAARKKLGRAAKALVVTNVVNAIVQSIIDALRDDDDEKWVEKFMQAFIGLDGDEETAWDKFLAIVLDGNLVSGMNPIAQIPFAKDVLSLVNGYDVSRTEMEIVSDLIDAGKTFFDSIDGGGKKTRADAVAGVIAAGAKCFGIPAANLKRDILAFVRSFAQHTGNIQMQYEIEKAIYNVMNEDNISRFADILAKARRRGDDDAYDTILNDIVNTKADNEGMSAKEKREYKEKLIDRVYSRAKNTAFREARKQMTSGDTDGAKNTIRQLAKDFNKRYSDAWKAFKKTLPED